MDTEKKNKPKRSSKTGRLSMPDNPMRVKVIRLTWVNLLLLAGVILFLFIWINNALQPALGDQVLLDQFVRNIKENRYSRVEIRNDGNAVGYGKYLHVVTGADLDLDTKGKEQLVKNDSDLEKKQLGDLVSLYKPSTENALDTLKNLVSNVNRSRVREILVLDNAILVDWDEDATKDWVIEGASEDDFTASLNSNNIDIATLPVSVSYLRSAGRVVEPNELKQAFENARYTAVWYTNGKIYARVSNTKNLLNYVNYGGALGKSDFTEFLQAEGVNLSSPNFEVKVIPVNQLDLLAVGQILLLVGLGVLGFMLMRSVSGSNGGLMKFGQSKARMFFGQKMNVTFKDVAGVDEAKEELREVVDFLKNPQKYQKIGAKIPRGVLMVGEPGTGKTLLARAVAGEAGVPFFHTSGSEFEEMLVGAGASRVRDLFDKAKKASPALIFIDEIDAVGKKRGTTIQSSSTEQTLNQILVEMDGFETRDNVIVIAATNRPDVLDPALLRAGRFDRKVVLDSPDIDGRKAILEIHSANKPLAETVDLYKVAKRTVGFSGADLANMLNEAAIIVAKDNRSEITMADIEEAATKVQTGPIRKRNRTQEELRMTAYHEAAHALVMKLTPQSDPVHRITILSRGMALGYTMPLPETDQLQMTKIKMESKIKALLAGFTAEELIFGDVTTGASNDIEKATSIAQQMVKRFGMSKKLGLVKYGVTEDDAHMGWGYGGDKGYSEATAEIIDDEVRRIIAEAHEVAKKLLEDNRHLLDQLSELLLKKEVVEGEEFEGLFKTL